MSKCIVVKCDKKCVFVTNCFVQIPSDAGAGVPPVAPSPPPVPT